MAAFSVHSSSKNATFRVPTFNQNQNLDYSGEGGIMNKRLIVSFLAVVIVAIFIAIPAFADSFTFSTGNPDGLIGTLSRPASAGKLQTETADDFVLSHPTLLNQATFVGLIPLGTPL
jgi:hypothetical protein